MVLVINEVIGFSKRLEYLKYLFMGIVIGHYIYRYCVLVKTVNSNKNGVVSKLTPLIANILGYKLGIC